MYSVHSVLHRLKFCVNPSGFTIKWYVLFSRLFNAVRGVVALRYFLSLLQIQPPGWVCSNSFYNSRGYGVEHPGKFCDLGLFRVLLVLQITVGSMLIGSLALVFDLDGYLS